MAVDRFLRACWREPVDATPVWFMRQAGRYLPGYRDIRARHAVLEIAKTPELASQVALIAVKELGVDAAILFADIVLPLEAMGVRLTIVDDVGPVIESPIRSPDDVDRLRPLDLGSMSFLSESIRRLREKLNGLPLIGFSAAPFTLASYLIEGKPSRDFTRTKEFLWREPGAWHDLMHRLSAAMASYLRFQVEAGADAIQVFDSWVGCLGPRDYRLQVMPHVREIFDALRDLDVPKIHFGTNTATLLPLMREAGGDIISVDWRIPIDEAWDRVGHDVAIQGNLDPAVLLAGPAEIEAQARDILERIDGRPGHVFNLGHGILPGTPVEHARLLVKRVHEWTSRGGGS